LNFHEAGSQPGNGRSHFMTRELVINPTEVFKAGEISFKPIPVMQYKPEYGREVEQYGAARLQRMYYDMLLIREFETMLNLIKTQGAYQGMEYNHPGPAHLSIGQEAAAVGQAASLTPEDYLFGSHRSHGEILAKWKSFSMARRSMPSTTARTEASRTSRRTS
jgi:2-oxoisovalerate dehydrogenase E1 component